MKDDCLVRGTFEHAGAWCQARTVRSIDFQLVELEIRYIVRHYGASSRL